MRLGIQNYFFYVNRTNKFETGTPDKSVRLHDLYRVSSKTLNYNYKYFLDRTQNDIDVRIFHKYLDTPIHSN